MGKVLFDRKWKILLETFEEVSPGQYKKLDDKTITDLKVTFNIRNTLLGDPHLASFQIYNINDSSKQFLTSHTCQLTFYAGYVGDQDNSLGILFKGNVTNAYPVRQGVNEVFNVWARTSFNLLEYTYPSIKSIKNPTSVKDIFEKLVKDAGLPDPLYVNNCDQRLSTVPQEDEYIPTGTFRSEFNDLLLNYSLGWQIQNDTMIVYDQLFVDPNQTNEDYILVNNKTGLLEVPAVDYTGISFVSLLNPDFAPTKVINVEPNTARYNLGNEFYVEKYDIKKWRAFGKFRIYEVTHEGDTRGDRWQSTVTAFYRRN